MIKTLQLVILIIVLCLAAVAVADTGVPQVPETQGFTTATTISAVGTATETDSIVSQIINNVYLNNRVPFDPPLYYYDTAAYTSSYTENTIADQGLVTYTKTLDTDTAGMAMENQFNVIAEKIVEFIGSDTGRMISDESNLVDGAGTIFPTGFIMLCPFADGTEYSNPPFCNIVEEGSNVDLTIGSLSTATEERHIMLSVNGSSSTPGWDYPVSNPGVEVNYNIRLTGFGNIPASGTATAFMNVHIQEGGNGPLMITEYELYKAEDLAYSESSTATGEITLFDKVLNYHSRITGSTEWQQIG